MGYPLSGFLESPGNEVVVVVVESGNNTYRRNCIFRKIFINVRVPRSPLGSLPNVLLDSYIPNSWWYGELDGLTFSLPFSQLWVHSLYLLPPFTLRFTGEPHFLFESTIQFILFLFPIVN